MIERIAKRALRYGNTKRGDQESLRLTLVNGGIGVDVAGGGLSAGATLTAGEIERLGSFDAAVARVCEVIDTSLSELRNKRSRDRA